MAIIKRHISHNGHFCASSYRLRDINILNFYLENLGQGHVVEKLDSCHSIKVYKSRREALTIVIALTVFQILYIYIFPEFCYLRNIGQGHDVQHSQWRYLVANINLYKSRT